MDRLSKCIRFQSRIILKSTLWFLGIYFAISLVLFLIFAWMITSLPNTSGNMNSGFFFAGAIFTFIYVAVSYKSNFNFMLMFGNTRKNIFFSTAVVSVVLSVIMTCITMAAQILDVVKAKIIPGNGKSFDLELLNTLYPKATNAASEFLWYMAVYLVVFSLAILYGAMAYKLGKIFIIAFWIIFSLSWMVLPAISAINGGSTLANAFKAYFSLGPAGNIMLATVNFIITAVIFGGAAYIAMKRQPQVV
jgi:hypothetical protein